MTREEAARRDYELGYMLGVKLAKGELKLVRLADGSVEVIKGEGE